MTTPSSIRVLCVDDHRIVREGIALILAREPDIEVVASAANADEAVAEFKRHRPDVTLMDLRLGETQRHRRHQRDQARLSRRAHRRADDVPGR